MAFSRFQAVFLLTLLLQIGRAQSPAAPANTPFPGYRGIWFELNQKYPYGDKYSGGLGTYTAKHKPLAVYAPEVDQTFFVYGGTTDSTERHLLAMIGVYDHATHRVSRPTVVYDKQNVNDPHDNPSLLIDPAGYLHVFVSGRGNRRPGIKLRSRKPYDISAFDVMSVETFAYPQIWQGLDGKLHCFTKYTGVRELYYEFQPKGDTAWTADRKLAGIREQPEENGGHYQVSRLHADTLLGTFFNRHPQGDVDQRTDLYYIQTRDNGNTWQNVQGETLDLPLLTVDNPAQVLEEKSKGRNVYMKDMAFTSEGHPICLIVRSGGHEPGPANAPYEWLLVRWTGEEWLTSLIATSDHNYDMGSLALTDTEWQIVAPTGNSPQRYGVGGEVQSWVSTDQGQTWQLKHTLTNGSPRNHAYIRRPLHAKPPFNFFWADGDPHQFSISRLYFSDGAGKVWRLPYTMQEAWAAPALIFSTTDH